MAIPSSGGPPKSIGIPFLVLRVGLPIAIGLAIFLLGSYLYMTHGVVQLAQDRESKGATIQELLKENEVLKKEKDERLAQLEALTDKTSKLAAAVEQVVDENAEIWGIVKGTGPAKKTSSGSPSAERGATSRGGDPGADRGMPVVGLSDAVPGSEQDVRATACLSEDQLAAAAAEELAGLLELTGSMQKDMSSLRSSAMQYRNRIDHTPSIEPVKGTIKSGFGNRPHPILRVTRLHEGVDIAASRGTPIVATADGVVTKAGWVGSYGNAVEISHGYGISTFYAHNSRNAVKAGTAVKKGQVIAYVGSTGLSTGPHVHYEVRVNKRPVNPSSYMK